jgi:segregation and condensation protein A
MTTTAAYELRLDEFSGPLDKLLELIEDRKLDVSRLSLAKVTDDFLRHVENLKHAPPALLADFIVVASQLILLKSKALLPELLLNSDEEGSLEELEERLKAYREFKEAQKLILSLWRAGSHEASRPYFLSISRSLPMIETKTPFYPGKTLSLQKLHTGLAALAHSLEKTVLEEETIKDAVITMEEKMRHILERLRQIEETKFSDLSSSASREEIIVSFLAILHMAREQIITIEQSEHFSDIIIKSNPNHQHG